MEKNVKIILCNSSPMTRHLYLFLFLLFIKGIIFSQPSWTQVSDFIGGERYGAAGFSIGDTGYVCSGSYDDEFHDLWAYDPATDAWTEKASLLPSAGNFNCASFVLFDKAYLIMGYNELGYATNDVWEYDAALNIWNAKSDFPGTRRQSTNAFVIGNYGYIMGGFNNLTDNFSDVWQYDPSTDTWTEKNNFPGQARSSAFTFATGDYGYLGGGHSYVSYITKSYHDFWRYQPQTDIWDSLGELPGEGVWFANGFSLNGKGYYVCGIDISLSYNTALWKYDPAENAWTIYPHYPDSAKSSGAVFQIDGKEYLTVGRIAPFQTTRHTWRFEDPDSTTDTTGTDTTTLAPLLHFTDQIAVYPNPANNAITVRTPQPDDGFLNIYNVAGEIMKRYNVTEEQMQYSVSDLPNGNYFIVYKDKKSTCMSWLIIMH